MVEGEDLRGPTAARTATAAAAVSAVEGTPSEGCTELVLRYTPLLVRAAGTRFAIWLHGNILQHVNLRKESEINHVIHCMQSLREKPATVAAAAAVVAGGSGEVRWGTSTEKVVAAAVVAVVEMGAPACAQFHCV